VSPPRRVHLPSGRIVGLKANVAKPRGRTSKEPLFSQLPSLVASGELELTEGAGKLDASTLSLHDFHALRALATHFGWLAEEPVTIACRNCGQSVDVTPCASLLPGPYVDGELDDPELDETLDLSVGHPIPAVHLPGGRTAREVRLKDVTVAEALPLHRALRRRRLAVSEPVVHAMGIVSLGDETRPRALADALAHCSDEAWAAIGDCFLLAHYSPRLAALVLCPKCGARNDVDAPYDREFEPSALTRQSGESNDTIFPDIDAFAAHAQASFDAIGGPVATQVRLVVDEGVPACDDGGEPLMGSYEPPGGDAMAPVGNGAVTLYYRTFRAIHEEDGPYDWQAEVDETIEHELEHHAGWRAGDDPMDDEERAEIAVERARLIGRKAVARHDVVALGADLRGFLARTWVIWVIVAVVTLAITVCDHQR
jgi:Zincin-like metallopeptidase